MNTFSEIFPDTSYTALHVHSLFSVLDSNASVEGIVLRAKELGFKGVCISDHGFMSSCIQLNDYCKEHDMKPIFANEVYIAHGSNTVKERLEGYKPSYHLLLIAKNEIGYKNLMRITSDSWVNGFYYKSRTSMSKLAELSEGIICTSACIGNFAAQMVLADRPEEAEENIIALKSIFGEDYYLEVQYSQLEEQIKVMDFYYEMSLKHDIEVVITPDSHYVDKEDSKYHAALVAINTGQRIRSKDAVQSGSLISEGSDTDESGMYYTPYEYYLKSGHDLVSTDKFNRFPRGLSNTNKIAEQCNVEFKLGGKYLPHIEGVSSGDPELRKMCEEGLEKFLAESVMADDLKQKYNERLEYELSVISKMEFSLDFLVVSEYTNWAKANGILTGPGRGSSAGSLVAFVTKINTVDPIRYNLLFERFLSRGRAKLPLVECSGYTVAQYLKDKEKA